MSFIERPIVGYVAFIIALFLIIVHTIKMKDDYKTARVQFANSVIADAEREARRIDGAFRSVYKVTTQIARLPITTKNGRVRTNIDARLKQSIQRTYTLLANNVRISKLYAVPADFDPQRVDPATGKAELPGVLYSEVEASELAGIPAHEITPLKEHQAWFKKNYAYPGAANAAKPPMISAPLPALTEELVSGRLGKTSPGGLMLSIPLFGADGTLKGSVTAIVAGSGMRVFTPAKDYALLNLKTGFFSPAHADGQEGRSEEWVRRGAPDPKLIASTVVGILAHDPRSSWKLWAGAPDEKYFESPVVASIKVFEIGGHLGIGMLLSLLLFMQWLGDARAKEKFATRIAEETKEAHEKTLEAERETRRLNAELEANMKKLSEAQRELVKHERLAALGQVTATLSHEIRNPLGAIRSSLYVVRHAAEKAEIKLDRPLERIERSVARCDNLIDDFLEYTRTNDLSLQPVDAAEFLTQLLDEQTLPEGVVLTHDLITPGPRIAVDPDRFLRVIINLVDNAAQAIKEADATGGQIKVSCAPHKDGSVIRVEDDGPGIPDDVLEKIFEPLFTTKSFGAGLGLATVKQLVEQHGAELKIDTEVGVGTTFSVVLPPVTAATAANDEPMIREKAA